MAVVEEKIVLVDEWRGIYGESWKGMICDEAFSHPAKFSRALIRKIYDHVVVEGWAAKGGSVVDPFGGVALGAFDAMRHGLNWTGCELEEKFVGLGGQNIALWNDRFSRMPNWGTARLLQGDSRKLGEVLSTAECCVSSPPYADAVNANGEGPGMAGNKARRARIRAGASTEFAATSRNHGYGSSEGQLGSMREGDHSIAISSPPYVGALGNAKNYADPEKAEKDSRRGIMSNAGASADKRYGTTDGNLGAMPEGQIAISSPPYEGSISDSREGDSHRARKAERFARGEFECSRPDIFSSEKNIGARGMWGGKYSMDPENVGNQRGETFWSASRLILEQLRQVIVPGGHAVFVVKAFVRDKKIVDFPAQWAQLCEAVGFKLLHDHHALLTEHYGTQQGFDGDKKLSIERKSFFRRLAEKKGSPRIDHENVLCFKRP